MPPTSSGSAPGPWAYRSFVSDRGWSPDEYEAWIGDTLYHQLMDPDAA